jgi:hypothetical protein
MMATSNPNESLGIIEPLIEETDSLTYCQKEPIQVLPPLQTSFYRAKIVQPYFFC